MRVTTKGQVTIPLAIRRKLGFLPNTEVEFDVHGNAAVVRKKTRGSDRGRRIIAQMKGKGDVKMTTEQIMALTRR
jgi:AbrB family looped-hinge helix DNA binding protein